MRTTVEEGYAEPLGRAVARRWSRAGAGGDVIVPVPVHAERARKRGYDQAVLIATVAARDLALPVAPILERARATTAQFDLDRDRRATNVHGAFRLTPTTGPHDPQRLVAGRWIVAAVTAMALLQAAVWYVGGDGDTGSLQMWQQKMLWVIGINLVIAGCYTVFLKQEPRDRVGAGR